MKLRSVALCLMVLAACCILFSGCTQQENSSSILLNEQTNACSLLDVTVPVFGPEEFRRAKGKPVVETRQFHVPTAGEVCVVVTNGLHDPPHGNRVSSAWIRIDNELAIGPDSFSQVVESIGKPASVAAGENELSVKLASKPGSFLSIELWFLPEDTEPPEIVISPQNGSLISTDMPFIQVSYSDDITGVDQESLSIRLNGVDVTGQFQVSAAKATWQVTIDNYLEEGPNELEVTISDRIGNTGSATSLFTVNTPTEVLLADLQSEDPLYRQRSAYKLLFRPAEIDTRIQWKCLRQLNETPEPKATNVYIGILLDSSQTSASRFLAAGALGEAAYVEQAVAQRQDVIDALGTAMMEDPSWVVKATAAKALGLTMNNNALPYLDEWITNEGPNNPPEPPVENIVEHLSWDAATAWPGFQVIKSIIRIAGEGYEVGNPGDLNSVREKYLEKIAQFLASTNGQGGAP